MIVKDSGDTGSGKVSELPHPPGAHPGRRPRRRIDWELISCGLGGHALVGTDAAAIGPEDVLVAREAEGLRWHRCLRCDSWVAIPQSGAPARPRVPARQEIKIPLRGKALRDRFVLRLIAVDRLFHFVVLGALGVVVLLFAAHESSLRGNFYRVLAALQGGAGGAPVQTSGHVGILGSLDKLFRYKSGHVHELGLALIAYAALEGIEGVGLWLTKRWAEYLTFIATTLLLPFEIYELVDRVTALRLIGFLLNLAVVVYLIWAKRLFGVRGGGTADERERYRDMDWEALERATPSGTVPAPATPPGTVAAP